MQHAFLSILLIIALHKFAAAIESPLHPTEARIVEQIIAVEGHTVEVADVPGWASRGATSQLQHWGIDTADLKTWGVRNVEKKSTSFGCIYNPNGRVLALIGNGPWLRDESLRALKGMPELRIIRFDHNGFVKNHPMSSLYSGAGLDALSESRLLEIRLTLGINDAGMEQAARIRGLKSFVVLHSQVSDVGVKFFEGHPTLESFSIAEMGNVSEGSLSSIAKMPKVKHIGFQEAFVTYEGGFKHLLGMKDRLKTLDLSMSLVNAADLELVRADHPNATITTMRPAEIVKRHRFVASKIARIATGEAAEELKRAIEASAQSGDH